jgi:hypothetical protein
MLVAEEPGNTDWQNVLSLTYEQIGDLLMNEGHLNESLEAYGAGLENYAKMEQAKHACERRYAAGSDLHADKIAR